MKHILSYLTIALHQHYIIPVGFGAARTAIFRLGILFINIELVPFQRIPLKINIAINVQMLENGV